MDSDTREFRGTWWVVGEESKAVGGTLSREGGTWQLSVIGELGSFGDRKDSTPLDIHGSANGTKFSLLGVFLVGRAGGWSTAEVTESRLIAERVLSGGHVDSSALFSVAVVGVRHLDQWANREAFKTERGRPKPGDSSLVFESPEMLESTLEFGTLWLGRSFRETLRSLTGGSFESHERAQFELTEPRDIMWIEHNCVRPLRSLMALAAASASFVLELSLVSADDGLVRLEALAADAPAAGRDLHPSELLFNLSEIEFGQTMARWWELYGKIGIALDLLESLHGSGSVSNHFLNAASAIESYHTHTNPKDKKSPEHNARVRRVVDAAAADDQAWLQQQLAFSHKTDFVDRVLAVANYAGPGFLHAIGDVNEWSTWVKKGRNSVAHRAPKMLDIEAEWRTTVRVTATISWLLTLVILRDLRIPNHVIDSLFSDRGFQHELSRLQIVKPEWFLNSHASSSNRAD